MTKYHQPLKDAERAAENGDLTALCQLIAWDKQYAFFPSAAVAIYAAEARGDRVTLRRIGGALSRLDQKRRRSPNQAFLDRIRELRGRTTPEEWARTMRCRPFRDTFANILADRGELPEALADYKNFEMALRRHGLL